MVVLSNFIANGLLFYVPQSFLVECQSKFHCFVLLFPLNNFFFCICWAREHPSIFFDTMVSRVERGVAFNQWCLDRQCMISVWLNWSSVESSLVTSSFRHVNMMSHYYLLWKYTGLFCFLEPVLLLKCCFAYQ